MSVRRYAFCVWAIIALCALRTVAALPPDPDNAALLYYRAFLVRPEMDGLRITKVLRGATPNEEIRAFLEHRRCRDAIELVQMATKMPYCNWGVLYSHGRDLNGEVQRHLSILGRVLALRARTLAADGDWRGAFEVCLTLRRFAAQIGDDTYILYAISQKVNTEALLDIRYVLGLMPSDPGTLTWLRDELGRDSGTIWSPAEAMMRFSELELQRWRVDPEHSVFGSICSESVLQSLMNETTRDEVLSRVHQAYEVYRKSALEIIDGDRSYEQKISALRTLQAEIKYRVDEGDPIALVWAPIKTIIPYYNLHVAGSANFNATMVATELYLIRARTGRLPERLPRGLAQDSFSGREFEYEMTDEGFILRGRVKPVGTRRVREYAFRAKAAD